MMVVASAEYKHLFLHIKKIILKYFGYIGKCTCFWCSCTDFKIHCLACSLISRSWSMVLNISTFSYILRKLFLNILTNVLVFSLATLVLRYIWVLFFYKVLVSQIFLFCWPII